MSHYEKINILLVRGTRKLQMVSHCIILKMGNAKQVQKSYLENLIPTPHIMSKSNFGAITNLESSMARKLPQPLLKFFQSPTSCEPWTSFEHHHKASLMKTAPKPLPQNNSIEHKQIPNLQPFFRDWSIHLSPTNQVKFELFNHITPQKSNCNFSMQLATPTRWGEKRHEVGRQVSKSALINATLSPFDKYIFHLFQ
jgi:hypothetical protein